MRIKTQERKCNKSGGIKMVNTALTSDWLLYEMGQWPKMGSP